VKDRRPSISPNFNFLGQLVEFDTQLTKQQADDGHPSSSQTAQSPDVNTEIPERAPSPSKRPCMINLSRAAQSRTCAAAVTAVQSPTTALSRLQFVEQRQGSSTAAVSVPLKSDGLVAQSPPTKSTTSDVVTSQQLSQELCQASSTATVDVPVPPKFTGLIAHNQSTFQSKSTSSNSSAGVTPGHQVGSSPSSSSTSVACSRQSTTTTSGTGTGHPSDGSRTADMLVVDWQASFKSRSLEDILLESTTTSPPRSLGHVPSGWADGSGNDESLAGHASLAASHGSLSNGHASLHGSLELIQVS